MCEFIPYKYKPHTFDQIHYNCDIKTKLLRLNSNKYIQNMIFYGSNGCCKKTLLYCYLNNYFNNDHTIYNTTTIDYTLSNNYKISYKVSSRHYQIYLLDNPKNNILIMSELLQYLIQNKNILNNNIIIIIHNIEKLQDNLHILKNISEKYLHVVLLCSSLKKCDSLSLFLQLRIRQLTYFELLQISVYINKYEKINLNPIELKNIILKSNNNINILLEILQNIINNSNEEYSLDNIIDIIKKKNIKDFPIIKTHLNHLLIYKCYNIDYIIEYIYKYIINFIKNKQEFISEVAILTKSIHSNNIVKHIILLDTYIFYIYKMIK